MKAIALLPVAAAAMMAFNISTALSQGACMQEYQACMDSCSTRSMKTLQDSCFNSCEGKNNMCAERVFGKRPFSGAPSSVAEQKSPAKDALARKDKAPEAAPQEQVADQQQNQAAPVAPQQTQAAPAAPQQRGSVRR